MLKLKKFSKIYIGTNSKLPLILLVFIITMLISVTQNTANAAAKKVLLKTIVIDMGEDTTVINNQYSKYFKENSAERGVKKVISTGKYFINNQAIPATAIDCAAKYPSGYLVNRKPWLYKDGNKWHGGINGEKSFDSYDAAALAVATSIPAGLEIKLYDTNNDGYTDLIKTQYMEALIVNTISHNKDGEYKINRGEIDSSINYASTDGRPFDSTHFTSSSNNIIKKSNFDPDIKEGNIALFWYDINGWKIKKAKEINGFFIAGADHKYYQINDVKYQDAMRFSRDDVIISNRPGEFANAQKYFKFINNGKFKVSLWLVPTTNYPESKGAPIGFTTDKNAGIFLKKAIFIAQTKLDSVIISKDAADLAKGTRWTTPAAYNELSTAIARAQTVLNSEKSPMLLDYQVYLLYLTLNGTNNDIGATFGGYKYTGFDKKIYIKK